MLEKLLHLKSISLGPNLSSLELASSLKALTLRLTVRHILLAANPSLLLKTRSWTGTHTSHQVAEYFHSKPWQWDTFSWLRIQPSPQDKVSDFKKRCCYSLRLGLTPPVTKLMSYIIHGNEIIIWLIALMMLTRRCCAFTLIHFREGVLQKNYA